jgi:hypothetical protein
MENIIKKRTIQKEVKLEILKLCLDCQKLSIECEGQKALKGTILLFCPKYQERVATAKVTTQIKTN